MATFIVIAMDGQGNVDFRGEEPFASEEIAKRIADGLNKTAERENSDWYYMPTVWHDTSAQWSAAPPNAPVAWGSNPNLVDCNAVNRITKALG